MKGIALITTILLGAILIYASLELPAMGDPASPASTHVSPRYIKESYHETGAQNIVTGVLADYRSYDTLGETVVIFTGGLGVLMVLSKKRSDRQKGGT